MELKITHMMKDADDMYLLSGSVIELGTRAGALTWENSQRYSKGTPLLVGEQIEHARDYFKSYGAWSDEDIAAWTVEDVQALVTQETASEIRELISYDTYEEYQTAFEQGNASGRIFKDTRGDWYISFYS